MHPDEPAAPDGDPAGYVRPKRPERLAKLRPLPGDVAAPPAPESPAPDSPVAVPSDQKPWVPAPQDPPPDREKASRQPAGATVLVGASGPVDQRRTLLSRFERFVDAPKSRVPAPPIEQLRQTLPPDRLIGWVVTLVVTAIAFVIRLVNLGTPAQILFDETYYAKDAWSMLQYGYEGTWVGDGTAVNTAFAQGDYSALTPSGEWAVHPPVGKWLIAAGQAIFGLTPFGWRFGSLVFGTLLVFMVIRLGRRLSRSTLIGGLAGLLLTVDGLSFVMSRIALLDIFQSFFIVAGVACVVADRDYFRNRLADQLSTLPGQTLAGRTGRFVFRPWLIAAGVMFGLGCGTKWDTVYPLAVFGIVAVVWSVSARRLAGARGSAWWGLLKDGVPAFISMVVLAAAVYLASWIPWLLTAPKHNAAWGAANPDSWVTRHFGHALGTLWAWHVATYDFHTGIGMQEATHTYASNPWGWPVLARTIGIYAVNGIQPGDQGCKAAAGDTCMRVITGLGTPLLWWAATLALIAGLVWWLAGMDWRFGVVVLATCSTWVPWIFSDRGAMFVFYAITMIPFMVIGLAMALGVILGPARSGPRRQSGAIIVGTVVALIILNFAFFYPILTGELITRRQWLWRIWLPGWV